MATLVRLSALASALAISACGGGGGSTPSTGGGGTTYAVSGQALKGPFAIGSQISVNEQSAGLSPTGKVYNVQTSDHLGDFTVPSGVGVPQVEIVGNGFYMNELTGQLSSAAISLTGIADLTVSATPTVNALTSLQEPRLKTLISQGMTFSAAYTQSQTEVLAAFGINSTKVVGLSTLYSMQINGNTDADSVLLATSVILGQMATDAATANGTTQPAELSNLVNTMASQISTGGTVTSSTFVAARNRAQSEISLSAVRSNVETYYSKNGVTMVAPKFEEWIDQSGSGILPQRLKAVPGVTFTDVLAASPNQLITSNVITISDVGAGAVTPVVVNAGTTIVKNNVVVTGLYADVQDGDTIALRVLSLGNALTYSATISVGSSTAVWHVTSVPLSGTINGLTGMGLVLQDNAGNGITIPAGSTSFSFPMGIPNGTGYSVSVLTQPISPLQICIVKNGTGTVGLPNGSISVNCAGASVVIVGTASYAVWTYLVAPDGTLAPVSGNTPIHSPQGQTMAVAVDPAGRFAFAATGQNTLEGSDIATYKIDPSSGALSFVSDHSTGNQVGSWSIATHPSGKFLIGVGGGIYVYSIDQSTGVLTPVAGSPFTDSGNPASVTFDPTGKFVYVPHGTPDISVFSIDTASGALTPIAGSPFSNVDAASFAAADPTGRFLYVLNNTGTASGFVIAPLSGALTPIAGFPVDTGGLSMNIAFDPSGHFVYIPNQTSNDASVFAIDQTSGALSPVPGSPFSVGSQPKYLAIDPTGSYAYVANISPGIVSAYTIDPITGALAPISGGQFGANSATSIAITHIP